MPIIDPKVEDQAREMLDLAIRGELQELGTQIQAVGGETYRHVLALCLTAAAYIAVDASGRWPSDADIRQIARNTVRQETRLELGEEDVYDYLSGAALGFRPLAEAFGSDEAAALLPVLITGSMLFTFRPRDEKWWEYLDQIWNAYEVADRLDASVFPAVQVRSYQAHAAEVRGEAQQLLALPDSGCGLAAELPQTHQREDNLFYLLEVSGKPLDVKQAVFEYGQTDDLVPAFGTFYARHLERALAGGVPRAYREFQDRLPGIRGRVDLPAQRRLAGLTLPAECRFDEYTANTQLNRILRGAADRLWRLPGVTIPTRQALQRLAAELGECGQVRPEDLRTRVSFTRLNEHCRSAERLARMALANEGLRDTAGASEAGVFLIDMNKVFEEFAAARLAGYLAGRLAVKAQQTLHLDTDNCVRIRPDLVFERGPGKAVYVADTKYKITADGYGREADYYQILAYATALGVPEGMLIYCQRDGGRAAARRRGPRCRHSPAHLARRSVRHARPSPAADAEPRRRNPRTCCRRE